jgi:hypothetical protein
VVKLQFRVGSALTTLPAVALPHQLFDAGRDRAALGGDWL